jgi:hypothetical protein
VLGLSQPLVCPNYESGLENMRDYDGFYYSSRPYFPESIEYFIEGQAFPPPYDLAPRPPLPPPSPVSKLVRRHTGRLRKRYNLLMGEGLKGLGEEQNHTTDEKAWSAINHSILSGRSPTQFYNSVRQTVSNLKAVTSGW